MRMPRWTCWILAGVAYAASDVENHLDGPQTLCRPVFADAVGDGVAASDSQEAKPWGRAPRTDHGGVASNPHCWARRTAERRSAAPSFRYRFSWCLWTVRGEIRNYAAMEFAVFPSPSSLSTTCSRVVSAWAEPSRGPAGLSSSSRARCVSNPEIIGRICIAVLISRSV